MLNGVVVHTGTDTDPNSSELLDMWPSQHNFYTPALDVPLTFQDLGAGVTIQTVSAGATGATVSVSLGPVTCVEANPTVSMTPTQGPWVTPGTTVTFTASVVNNDNAACTASTFNLSNSVPAGWSATFGAPTLTLAPGASDSTTLQVTSPAGTPDGFYNVTATATNASASNYTASATSTYVISTVVCTHANPTVSMTPAQNLGLPGSSVTYNLSLVNNDSTGCSASAFTLGSTVPAGWSALLGAGSLTLAPGANGSTNLQVNSSPSAPAGTYNVAASGTNSGASGYAGSATSTYVVQSPLSMTLKTDAFSYTKNQSVNMTATVTSAGSPVSGASVQFLITLPDSTGYRYFVTTGSNGVATLKFRLSRKSPSGTYSVTASTSTNQGSAQATTTFSVQ